MARPTGCCSAMNNLRKFIVTGLGTGYLPIAPGTWASGVVCVIFLILVVVSRGNAALINGAMIVLAVLAGAACVGFGRFASGAFGKKDPHQCTLDEWAGQALTLFMLPGGSGGCGLDWLVVVATAFVAFRIFDIFKPPPARALERLPAGWGVLLDDIAAGVYANIAAQLLLRFWLLGAIHGFM